MQRTEDKEIILKAAIDQRHIAFKSPKIRPMTNVSTQRMEPRR
jgi:hypothetical protein